MRDGAVRDDTATSKGTGAANEVIDIHVHILGIGDGNTGCRVSREFRLGTSFASMLMGLRIPPFAVSDLSIRQSVLSAIETSSFIDRAVVLALDGVYKNGSLAEASSHVVVPNDYVLALTRESSRVLFGASVHPYRQPREMLRETKRCIDAGASMFFWAPASQQINPDDERCIPFYVALAHAGVPLLCQGGLDFGSRHAAAMTTRYNDIRGLTRALDMGVKVIFSFGHSSGVGPYPVFNYESFEDLISMLRAADNNAWDLYLDISSLCAPSGVRCLDRLRVEMSGGAIRPGRLLFGSDFPRPVIDINSPEQGMTAGELRSHMVNGGNLLDRVYGMLKEFGVADSVFSAAGGVLRR